MINESLKVYSNAKSKLEKTRIVSHIIESIRARSPSGGFIRQDENGQWYEVGDHMAREKVGQSFRDLLHGRYKSSTKAKRCRRRRQNEQLVISMDLSNDQGTGAADYGQMSENGRDTIIDDKEIESIVRNNIFVTQRMSKLVVQLADLEDQGTNPDTLSQILLDANKDILEEIKKGSNLQHEYIV
jgi:hypothetical protein